MRSLFVLGLVVAVLVLAGAVVVAQDATITGTVEKTDDGCLVIETDDGAVAVAPCKCEEAMPDKCPVCKCKTLCGKEVKATGAVKEEDGKKTITLTKVEEVKAE